MRKGDFLFNDIIKGLHLPLACAMLLLVFCLPSAAWEGAADTKWYDDAPTAASYAISTAEEFAGLAALVNAASCDFEGKTIGVNVAKPKADRPAGGYGGGNRGGGYGGGYGGNRRY